MHTSCYLKPFRLNSFDMSCTAQQRHTQAATATATAATAQWQGHKPIQSAKLQCECNTLLCYRLSGSAVPGSPAVVSLALPAHCWPWSEHSREGQDRVGRQNQHVFRHEFPTVLHPTKM